MTDFPYAHYSMPHAPFVQVMMDGQPMEGVCEASSVAGWIIRHVIPFEPNAEGDGYRKVREHGVVEIIYSNEPSRELFQRVGTQQVFWAIGDIFIAKLYHNSGASSRTGFTIEAFPDYWVAPYGRFGVVGWTVIDAVEWCTSAEARHKFTGRPKEEWNQVTEEFKRFVPLIQSKAERVFSGEIKPAYKSFHEADVAQGRFV
jgi:hypothetical protein